MKEQLNNELRRRIARCQYLKRRGDSLKAINPEQTEAYYQRINWHKPKMIKILEKLERTNP